MESDQTDRLACLTVYLTACLPGFLLDFVVFVGSLVFVGPDTFTCLIARPFLSAKKSADFATRSSRRFYELGPTFSIDLSQSSYI